MGNCCSGGTDGDSNHGTGTRAQAFQGEGHRLGSVDEVKQTSPPTASSMKRENDVPAPVLNPNLTNEEREKIRADRAAAAEARLKKQNPGKKKTATNSNSAPLKGPNTQPLMRWN